MPQCIRCGKEIDNQAKVDSCEKWDCIQKPTALESVEIIAVHPGDRLNVPWDADDILGDTATIVDLFDGG